LRDAAPTARQRDVPALLPALAALCLAGSGMPAASRDPDATAAVTLALAARGSPASLAAAMAAVPPEARADPAWRGASANRALARLLEASALREEASRKPGGDADLRRARSLREDALDELRPLVRAAPGDPAVVRALAVYAGLGGDVEGVSRIRGGLVGQGADDPWLAFATAYAEARAQPPALAAGTLASFAEAHPGILPPRISLARAQVALGRREDALATLDALLLADPDHDGAKAFKAELLAPPPPLDPPPVPTGDPPRGRPGILPRKGPAAPGEDAGRA
jgi:tetratricopeptide (TPR) repeat protein